MHISPSAPVPLARRPTMYSTGGASVSSLSSRRTRASNCCAPAGPVSVSLRIDSIGTAWRTGANSDAGTPPTRCVGESGVASDGYCASSD